MGNSIKVGSVVFAKNGVDIFKGPGTVTALFREFDVDFATVFWQGSCVSFDHRLSNLLTLSEKYREVEGEYE